MSRSTTHKTDPQKLVLIGLDTEDGAEHPLYQTRVKRKIPKDQIEAAKAHGISDVILCTKVSGFKEPVVVAGRQRVKALRLANADLPPKERHKIEYKLVKGDDAGLVTLMIRENALRTDLTPLEKARDARKLVDFYEDSNEGIQEAAFAFGVSRQCIKDWLQVTEMAKPVQRAVEQGKISCYNALQEFRKVEVEDQPKKLEKVLAKIDAKPKNPKTGKPITKRKPKGHKDLVAFMADDSGSSLSRKNLLLLQFAVGTATKAECIREIPNFKKSLERAERQLKKEEEA